MSHHPSQVRWLRHDQNNRYSPYNKDTNEHERVCKAGPHCLLLPFYSLFTPETVVLLYRMSQSSDWAVFILVPLSETHETTLALGFVLQNFSATHFATQVCIKPSLRSQKRSRQRSLRRALKSPNSFHLLAVFMLLSRSPPCSRVLTKCTKMSVIAILFSCKTNQISAWLTIRFVLPLLI